MPSVLDRLRNWLRFSPHFHVKDDPVHDLRSCVELIDRFIDDRCRYPLEWDDFISWSHSSPGIDSVRVTIADLEPMFFSADPESRAEATRQLVAERNRVAALLGIPGRDGPGNGSSNDAT